MTRKQNTKSIPAKETRLEIMRKSLMPAYKEWLKKQEQKGEKQA